jgi:hypothetical protein
MVDIGLVVGIIGVGIALMVGYLVLSQVSNALPAPQTAYANSCLGKALNDTTYCNTTAVTCGPITDNTSATVTCDDVAFTTSISSTQTTVFAGFGLLGVGIIVLAAFALIQVFRMS